MTGDAFTFVSPDEERDLPRHRARDRQAHPAGHVPGFDYTSRPTEALEIPLGERLAAMRAQRSAGHARRNAGSAPARPSSGHPGGHPGGHRPARGPHGRPARSGKSYGGGRSQGSRG